MKFTLDANHKAALEKLVKSGMTPVAIAQRAKILLLKASGKSAGAIADEVGVSRAHSGTVDQEISRTNRRRLH